MSSSRTTCPVLGVECFAGDLDEAAALVVERACSGDGGYASLMNVHVAMTAQRDAALRAALAGAHVVFADGAPIAWLERRLGCAGARRVAGPDLMPLVLERGREHGLRHFLFGSSEDVLRRLRDRYPEDVVGSLAPPFGPLAGEHVAAIRTARPHIVWVALGAPKQELWARCHAELLAPAFVVGVGAAFDFHAGAKARAPVWMQNTGLEWLHRLITEPRRLGWRYVSTNSRFVIRAVMELARD